MSKDIAIIGFSGKFPGAGDVDEFWNKLENVESGITEIPKSRFDIDEYYDPDPKKPGKICSRYGGFLDSIAGFDYSFFGVGKREADRLDPQQRLFCEQVWYAFENAGYTLSDFAKFTTGVFAGIGNQEYVWHLMQNEKVVTHYTATGNGRTFIPNRISHCFNFTGPSLVVDTACSSSMSAVHLARQSLLLNECDIAIAGGVNLAMDPFAFFAFTKAGLLSKNGKCRVFDEKADGYVRGEGVGAVILKRLKDAAADGDKIYGVIKDMSMVHHGKSYSITAPSLKAQISLLEKIYSDKNINPESISYIEAGSTGTHLGDPVEIRALKTVFSRFTAKKDFCAISSVKTNVGHLEGASGICALIKVILALKNKRIPGMAGFEKPNKFIKFAGSPFYPNIKTTKWKKTDFPRRAGITGFGFAGTDMHLVIEEYDKTANKKTTKRTKPVVNICALSAKTETSLKKTINNLTGHLLSREDDSTAAVCYTQTRHRTDFEEFRSAVTAGSREELTAELENAKKELCKTQNKSICFLFSDKIPDNESCELLYDKEPIFKKHFDECTKILKKITGHTFAKRFFLKKENGWINKIIFFMLRYCSAKMLLDLGVKPASVSGSSSGFCIAAALSGMISLKQALDLAVKYLKLELVLEEKGLIDTSNYEAVKDFPETVELENALDKIDFEKPQIKFVSHSGNVLEDAADKYFLLNEFFTEIKQEIFENSGDNSLIFEFGKQNDLRKNSYCLFEKIGDTENPILSAIACAYNAGADINWEMYYKGRERRQVDLPRYPFDKVKCWVEGGKDG